MNRQDKIMIVLLVLNFLVIGTYSTAVSIPQEENLNISLNLNETKTTLNRTDKNDIEIQDNIKTDESTDSSKRRTINQRNTRTKITNQTNNDQNPPEEPPEEPPIENPDNSVT